MVLRLMRSVPRCSLRGRSGARQPRHARAKDRAARGSGRLRSSLPLRCAPRPGGARSGRESRVTDRTGKRVWGATRLTMRRADGSILMRQCPIRSGTFLDEAIRASSRLSRNTLARGAPVIAFGRGGACDIVEDGRTGVLNANGKGLTLHRAFGSTPGDRQGVGGASLAD